MASVTAPDVPCSLAAPARRMMAARGNPGAISQVVERCPVPMFTVDGSRRFVDVNLPARLLFRHSLAEMQQKRIEDLTPPERMPFLLARWNDLLTNGAVGGPYVVGFPDGTRLDVVYWALAHALPRQHVVAFAPAAWPADELDRADGDAAPVSVDLTGREMEVLRLTARGQSAPAIAETLVISPSTVKTHLGNVYAKLEAPDRAGAVAKAMRMGLID
jgi:DNA-binding CsgD family transcriptional regulator